MKNSVRTTLLQLVLDSSQKEGDKTSQKSMNHYSNAYNSELEEIREKADENFKSLSPVRFQKFTSLKSNKYGKLLSRILFLCFQLPSSRIWHSDLINLGSYINFSVSKYKEA